MSRSSVSQIFQGKLVQWILVPGLFMTFVLVSIIGINQVKTLEREVVQLSRSLSRNVEFYIDGAEDVLRSVAIMSGDGRVESLRVYFDGLHKLFGQFERLLLLDKNENIVAVSPHGIKGIDFPIRFSGSDKSKRVLTSPIISPHSGKLVVYISIPVEGGGKLVAELSLATLQNFIYGFLSSNRIIILTDSYGNLIVHPDRELVKTQANVGALDVFKKKLDPGQGGFYRAEGRLCFGRVENISGTGWKMLVACSVYSLFQPVLALGLLITLLVVFFFMVLLFALKKQFRQQVVGPLVGYVKKLSAVAKGDYPTATSAESDFTELDELGRVFDSMAEQVREREHDLTVSKRYFQSVIDSMPSALIWVDEDMNVCQCNLKALELFDLESTEIEPENVEVFFGGRKDVVQVIAEAKDRNSPRTLERTGVGNDSSSSFDITAFPLRGFEVKGIVVRIDDVTSRVRMEEIMVQTEKMMSVGGLAAGMAHEINNPLGGIMQGAQNLERKFSPDIKANIDAADEAGCSLESMQKYMESRNVSSIIEGIRDSGLRAARIVSNMLDFSKPGKDVVSTVNVHELIEDSLELSAKDYDLKRKYDFMHINIVREFSRDIPDIICSRTEIEQVLLNLFKNSAQAMSDHGSSGGTPHIYIRTRSRQDAVVIEIEDNGPGMNPDVRKRIFEPFYTTKASGAGTGLGLSVSYFIITQNHGGTFTVSSMPGRGARFTITLPVQGRRP
ncbi:PAS domain-containing sensor histidine kinase [Desulfovibrio sp. JC010]|uniref:sensor histidine kinase n=1 Tax=Desulfovibrio sp. JC010 TaxID=2593641 RepID=UPI0013D49F73|nr:PAS domain-containing sensor histidine kinase [Desulfovibrio sp. JC010]NDV27848.1 PAS domain-containing protein [Desulfovibrio sp. JC010]